MATYYRLHGGGLSLAECWRLGRSWPKFLTLLLSKPLGGFPFRFSIARPDEPGVVPLDALPACAQDRLRGPVADLLGARLELAFYQRSRVLEPHRVGAGAVLLSPDELVTAHAVPARPNRASAARNAAGAWVGRPNGPPVERPASRPAPGKTPTQTRVLDTPMTIGSGEGGEVRGFREITGG